MTAYELYWLRELPGGALGGPYGGENFSLSDLPINETLAGRIRALSVPGTRLRLHLPYVTHRDRRLWPARQLDLPVSADGRGNVVVGDKAEHQFAALLAAPKLDVSHPLPITFEDDRVWQAADWASAVQPMLAAHRIKLEDPAWTPTGPVRLRWVLQLPEQHSCRWADVAHRREARFLDEFRGVSTSIQIALRTWLPFQYFANAARLAQPQFAHPYLVYGLLPPHPSRRKTQLTFHVLEPQRVVRSMTRLTRPLAERLRRVRARLQATGVSQPMDAYLPENAGQIVRAMHRLPRTFGALLSQESFIVEEFVRFATVAHDLRDTPPRARAHVDPGLELLYNLRGRLSRSYGGENYVNLANLILLAATAGLVWRDEPAGALEARITATELDTGREIRGASRFSYANF